MNISQALEYVATQGTIELKAGGPGSGRHKGYGVNTQYHGNLPDPKTVRWYHGTNASKKIEKSGKLKPRLADDDTYGKSIFFSTLNKDSSGNGASEFGKTVYSISENDLRKLVSDKNRHTFFNYGEGELMVHKPLSLKHLTKE